MYWWYVMVCKICFWSKFLDIQEKLWRSKKSWRKPANKAKIALLCASMVVIYYTKLFHTLAERHNGILLSLLLLVTETIRSLYLYHYLWQTSVRIILDCINVFLDPECIASLEDFQHKTLKTLVPLLYVDTSRTGKRELWELSVSSEATV